MAKKGLGKLIEDKDGFDKESQAIISSFVFRSEEIGMIGSMKSSEGWKILDKKIREELQSRIEELVKDDLKIQTLLALLKVADIKSMSRILEEEIERVIPE